MSFILRKMAKIKNDICHQFFLLAWGGWVMPRSIRRLIAGSQIHRAWFLGYNHFFEEDGVWYGLGRSYGEMLDQDYREFSAAYQKAREEEINRIEAEGSKYYTDDELRQSQWDDYYEYTGMADLAHELRAEEEGQMKHE